jgi:hypothetical protein
MLIFGFLGFPHGVRGVSQQRFGSRSLFPKRRREIHLAHRAKTKKKKTKINGSTSL